MSTFAITGSASGIGAATAARLQVAGHRTIGIDRTSADVVVGLSTTAGRAEAAGEPSPDELVSKLNLPE